MTSIKITPFVLFLILLIVLVISAFLGSYYSEGFISYEFVKQPIDLVAIPQYSTNNKKDNITTYKLLDNLYFDNKNGNLIEIDGVAIDPKDSTKYDDTAASIISIYVTTRDNPQKTINYPSVLSGSTVIAKDTPESLIDSISNSYKTFRYDSQSTNTSSYSVFYVSWSNSTFINIISNKTKVSPAQILCSYMFNPTTTINSPIESKSFDTNNDLNITKFVEDTDINNNTLVLNNNYDKTHPLYQMSKCVYYDSKNGNLIVDNTLLDSNSSTIEGATTQTAAKSITHGGPSVVVKKTASSTTAPVLNRIDPGTGLVISDSVIGEGDTQYKPLLIYDRTSTDVTNKIDNTDRLYNNLQNVPFTAWYIIDTNGQNFVIYNANGKNTVITILRFADCCKKQMFDIVNVKRFLNGVLDESGSTSSTPARAPAPSPGSGSKSGSRSGSRRVPPPPPSDSSPSDNVSSDYILKTQIIPPVCPTCYSVEINRGISAGGSGSVPAPTPTPTPTPSPTPSSGSGSKPKATGDQTTIDKPLANLAGDVVKTINDLGDVNLLSSFWGNNIGDGIINNMLETPGDPNFSPIISARQQEGDYSGANNGLPFVPGTDPYSYYGALPPKGNSNYMPVTADFSSFGN